MYIRWLGTFSYFPQGKQHVTSESSAFIKNKHNLKHYRGQKEMHHTNAFVMQQIYTWLRQKHI